MSLDDELGLAPERSSVPPWRVLIVDDEPEIHAVTRLVLSERMRADMVGQGDGPRQLASR